MLAAALASALVAAAVASAANGRQHPARTPAAVPGSIIVGFKSNVSAKGRAGVLGAVDARPTKRFAQIDSTVVSVSPANTNWTIRTLEQDPRVAYAEPNFILHAADTPERSVVPAAVVAREHRTDRRPRPTRTSTRPRPGRFRRAAERHRRGHRHWRRLHPAGPRPEHLDQRGRDLPGLPNGIDDDGNGYVDDWRGWNFVNHDNNPMDDNGHGTHVAGTIGAPATTASAWPASPGTHVMALKFLERAARVDRGRDQRDRLRARQRRADHEQLVGRRPSRRRSTTPSSCGRCGVLFVAAAGNDFTNTDSEPF